MEFIRINKWIHAYNMPIHDYLESQRDKLTDMATNPRINNFRDKFITDKIIRDSIDSKFQEVANQYYDLSPVIENIPNINLYIQDNTATLEGNNFHNHAHLVIGLCGVTYLDLPQEGGELEFMLTSPSDTIIVKLLKDWMYFFPYWLYHRPLPQKDTTNRICVNWQHSSIKRPVHKLTGDIW